MPDITARLAPDLAATPQVPTGEWLDILPPATRFMLYAGLTARRVVAPIWGVGFAEEACRATVRGARSTLWMGPDEYLLLDQSVDSDPAAAAAIRGALSAHPHSLVEVSHRQFALQVSGPHAATIVSGACPLDLDLTQFPIGMCTRTVFAKAEIVLWRTRADAFHLEVWRSFSGYVSGLLGEIAREFYWDGGGARG